MIQKCDRKKAHLKDNEASTWIVLLTKFLCFLMQTRLIIRLTRLFWDVYHVPKCVTLGTAFCQMNGTTIQQSKNTRHNCRIKAQHFTGSLAFHGQFLCWVERFVCWPDASLISLAFFLLPEELKEPSTRKTERLEFVSFHFEVLRAKILKEDVKINFLLKIRLNFTTSQVVYTVQPWKTCFLITNSDF